MGHMRTKVPLTLAVLLGLLALPLVAGAADLVEVGKVRIPRDFKYGGSVHARGVYQLSIEPGAEGSYLVLVGKDGKEAARELAIAETRKERVRHPRVSVALLTRQEHMVRITVRHGRNLYLAYFEMA